MPVWLLWTIGSAATGYVIDQLGDAAEQSSEFVDSATQLVVAAGAVWLVVFVLPKVLK